MKSNILHSIVVCLTAFALPFMVSCSLQEEPLSEVTETALCLRVSTIGSTRSQVADLSDNEKMKSLRVVVLHEDGTVEHNKHYTLVESENEEKRIYLKVTPNENKKIFLFANEESVTSIEGVTDNSETDNSETESLVSLTSFFEKYSEDTENGSTDFESAVNGLYFAPDYSDGKAIPMSSTYDITIGNEGNVEKQFYMVRVATKFEVKFLNWRGEEVTVNNFTVSSHADKNYLMARVEDSERNKDLFNGKTWIEWLKDVSDASSTDDDYATTEAAGWLKDYGLPSDADQSKVYVSGVVTVPEPIIDTANPSNSKAGVKDAPIFYLPESRTLTAGEQTYTMTFNIDGRTEPFVCPMPNLKSLFRNTHVIVNVTLKSNQVELEVIVEPYTEVVLEPGFGIPGLQEKEEESEGGDENEQGNA